MELKGLFGKFNINKVVVSGKKGDIVDLLNKEPEYFANKESNITHKPTYEIIEEIKLGLMVHDLEIEPIAPGSKNIILIPPKYDFWTYFIIAVKLSQVGFNTTFLFHNWSKKLINLIKYNLNYIKYVNLKLENVEDYEIPKEQMNHVLNFSDGIKGIPNTIPSFSTAIVTEDCDLDYVMAYIFSNAFSFSGLKNTNLKRIIVDESIKEKFQSKVRNRLSSLNRVNESKIRSKNNREQLHNLISDGISEGAELIFGNSNFDRAHFNNIVFDNVTKDMRIYQKNFYGPVLMFTYTSFDPFELKNYQKVIQQQPSNGLVVFSNNNRFIDLKFNTLRKFIFIKRPAVELNEYSYITEYQPSLEAMFYILGII